MPEESKTNEAENRQAAPKSSKKNSPKRAKVDEGWRVKLYRLNQDGSWDDCGTGRIQCLHKQTVEGESPEATLCVTAEVNKTSTPRVLLRTRVLLTDAYQRQGDNIITWCEPCYYSDQETAETGVDLALSFQDNEGCLDIWRQIMQIQSSVEDLASQTAAQHHAHLLNEDFGALPTPDLSNLEEIADTIANLYIQQREALANWIVGARGGGVGDNECDYLKDLLGLFQGAESCSDYGKLATLAACVKTILLLNEPSILELIVNDAALFEQVCSCLEYDPDLREKANHRWFLKTVKFRTVVPMDDPELIAAIHRSFRVQYLRDTLLRPTMDESSLSTLSSLLSFTHADVIKGVTNGKNANLNDSYLVRVIRLLGIELHTIQALEWNSVDVSESRNSNSNEPQVPETTEDDAATWKQYIAPQDFSLPARRLRRRGCLSFLRELFNMVRLSLQQCDKDDFFSVLCTLEIDLENETASQTVEVGSLASDRTADVDLPTCTNLLSLMANILLDPTIDVSEKDSVLEILAGAAVHDSGLIRRHCLEEHRKKDSGRRPEPNEHKQVLFIGPPNDLLAALLFLLDVEKDAGIILQVSEIMRIILDTDIIGDPLALDESNAEEGPAVNTTDQKRFLSIFYENYIDWLVAPFSYTILHPTIRVPEAVLRAPASESNLLKRMTTNVANGVIPDGILVVEPNAMRTSFAIEVLSFCVRAHLYRMKSFLLKSRALGSVLKLLQPQQSSDRCLKLAALRFLRTILSVNDEFYHRHIIQHDLFAPVFEAFRANPVGDNLVSSAIVEMCDYIRTENIKSLIEYIVMKHLLLKEDGGLSLEDVSSPYVTTLTTLRKAYEKNEGQGEQDENGYTNLTPVPSPRQLTGKALEDQRKFHEVDEEESYFMDDDAPAQPVVDEVDAQEMHRTPRMFSMAQAPLLNNLEETTADESLEPKDEDPKHGLSIDESVS